MRPLQGQIYRKYCCPVKCWSDIVKRGMSVIYKTYENTGLTVVRCMVFPLIAPVWGEYYRIGACPYLLGITIFCPCKGRRVQYHNELCAPYRGKVCVKHKRRGKPLRYNLSSLWDSPVAKVLPDTNVLISVALCQQPCFICQWVTAHADAK